MIFIIGVHKFISVLCVVSNIYFGVDGNVHATGKKIDMATNCFKIKAMEWIRGDFLAQIQYLHQ